MSRRSFLIPILLIVATVLVWSQSMQEEFRVYREHPRLFLDQRRSRLLQREVERQSVRWQQLQLLAGAKARLAEPGFAMALFSRVARDPGLCREAVRWARGETGDLRQLAIVFDWCQDSLTPADSQALADKLRKGIERGSRRPDIPAVRDRVLAAVVLADRLPELAERELRFAVQEWWHKEIVPALKSGRLVVPREDTYALLEILHAIRDNLQIDLREPVPGFFKELPACHLLSYYPASYPAPENEYRIPAIQGASAPDLRHAMLSRAAEFAMVAYDPNILEHQFLQGWLIHDAFMMRSSFGAPYEFLWANPYHPGLSYYHMPLHHHDTQFGRLFIRSSWEEDAIWLGYSDGELQVFEQGAPKVIRPGSGPGLLAIGEAAVFRAGEGNLRFTVQSADARSIYVVGLAPRSRYEIEVDDEQMRELETDPGGILAFTVSPRAPLGVRIRKSRQ